VYDLLEIGGSAGLLKIELFTHTLIIVLYATNVILRCETTKNTRIHLQIHVVVNLLISENLYFYNNFKFPMGF